VKPDFEKVKEKVLFQNEENKVFSNNDPYKVALMVKEEAGELVSELEKAYLTDDLTQVAGEIGDVIYLALKMCGALGLNADEVVEMKIERNKSKYSGHSDRSVAKSEWEIKGGDLLFYEQYLLLSCHENEPT